MARILSMQSYYRATPPVNELVAGFIDYQGGGSAGPEPDVDPPAGVIG